MAVGGGAAGLGVCGAAGGMGVFCFVFFVGGGPHFSFGDVGGVEKASK